MVLWGNLELAFANSEELGIFTSALKYVDVEEGSEKEVPPAAKIEKEGAEGRGLFGGKGSLYDWVVPVSVSLALLAVVSYHVVKKRQ